MRIVEESHLDHGLSRDHVKWLLEQFGDRTAFFLETVDLPEHFTLLDCEMHGPLMGDPPISESEVAYVVRGKRRGATRVVDRPKRQTRKLTVIGGPIGDYGSECVLYTAFGGPAGAKEVWDDSIKTLAELEQARAFWREHALSK